ncbi:MAG: CPBP family intramembrane metalloprotease [Pirellulales bacterium]|nr:CPBP family intramembrane metalloprotease [Pirellulales bacterium]
MMHDPATSTFRRADTGSRRADTGSRRADTGAVLLALTFPTLVTWLYFVVLADHAAAVQQVAYGVGKTLQFAFPAVWVLAWQRRRLRPTWPRTRGLAESVGFGLFVLAAMLVLYHVWLEPAGYLAASREEIRRKVLGFGLDSPLKYIGLGVFYALGHSLLEEYYWRWFVFGQLRELLRLWPAILVSSFGFMAHHVIVLSTFFGWQSPATWLFSLAVAVGGIAWAWIYQRSQSLYGPWLSHLFVDAGIFAIGYEMVKDLLAG